MKRLLLLPMFALFCLFTFEGSAQDEPEQLNLPGDNLNLYAVMKLFQDSPTLEEFEKKLNDESTKINNLDLDGDNKIDYIKVVDIPDGDIHNISLKVAVNKDEDQDVAVFVVKKESNGQVDIQLIGDEALYGKDYIIEPNTGSSTPTPNPGYTGNATQDYPDADVSAGVEVSAWPLISYMYVPSYNPWRSPYHWGYYPSYWQPWTPFFWHEYYGYQYHWDNYYRAHYRYTPVYRFPSWHERYYGGGLRSRSSFVSVRVNRGDYRQTYTHPELANRGSDLFRRDHPQARSANRPLPQFDRNNNNRPIVNRPDRGNSANNGRQGDNNSSYRTNGNNTPNRQDNGNNPSSRPDTRPGGFNRDNNNSNNSNNNNNNNNNNNAGNRPGTPAPNNGNPAPDRPQRSYNGNNFPRRPGATNARDAANSNGAPATRPVTPRSNDGNNVNRPVRPMNTNPGNGNFNRPSQRPADGSNMPNRPVARPAAPQRQQEVRQPQPSNRPANERPAEGRRHDN